MRQLAAHQPFIDPTAGFSVCLGAGDPTLNRMLLAIGRALSPPVVHMRSTFHPMRVIVVQPDLLSTMDRAAEWGCQTPQLLPALHPDQTRRQDEPGWRHRIVHGEILSDENGRLFEKCGRYIRPVHQLASGPSGELIEMAPAKRNNLRVISPSASTSDAADRKVNASEKIGAASVNKESVLKKFVPVNASESETSNPGHRKLFTDPGQWRVVTWGEFKEILAPQLSHPERLRDTYRLPCYVQVIETNRDVSIEELAKEFSTSNVRPKPLYFLTNELATKLELTSLLPPLPVGMPEGHRVPNLLLAHQRVFRLLVANDPTVDVGNCQERSGGATRDSKPAEPEMKAKQTSPTAGLKTSIPDLFVKEWEFKWTREEALYDMNRRSLFAAIRSFIRRFRLLKQQSEFRKWQVFLTGKDVEEQLWSVRPPAGLMSHHFVREWVRKTLELAGYDAGKMVGEWEIFWRRRGLY